MVLSGRRKTPLRDTEVPVWRHVEAVVGYLNSEIKNIETKETP